MLQSPSQRALESLTAECRNELLLLVCWILEVYRIMVISHTKDLNCANLGKTKSQVLASTIDLTPCQSLFLMTLDLRPCLGMSNMTTFMLMLHTPAGSRYPHIST